MRCVDNGTALVCQNHATFFRRFKDGDSVQSNTMTPFWGHPVSYAYISVRNFNVLRKPAHINEPLACSVTKCSKIFMSNKRVTKFPSLLRHLKRKTND